MQKLFSFFSNTKRARFFAILWTLLIFFLCFIPAREIPDVNIPLADKWVHFILFGIFSILWLLSIPNHAFKHLVLVFITSLILGWLVEEIQGLLVSLGRNKDNRDILADAIGGFLGVLIYSIVCKSRRSRIQ
jgi:VanZ family protein